jgi:hypothetical protein
MRSIIKVRLKSIKECFFTLQNTSKNSLKTRYLSKKTPYFRTILGRFLCFFTIFKNQSKIKFQNRYGRSKNLPSPRIKEKSQTESPKNGYLFGGILAKNID